MKIVHLWTNNELIIFISLKLTLDWWSRVQLWNGQTMVCQLIFTSKTIFIITREVVRSVIVSTSTRHFEYPAIQRDRMVEWCHFRIQASSWPRYACCLCCAHSIDKRLVDTDRILISLLNYLKTEDEDEYVLALDKLDKFTSNSRISTLLVAHIVVDKKQRLLLKEYWDLPSWTPKWKFFLSQTQIPKLCQ